MGKTEIMAESGSGAIRSCLQVITLFFLVPLAGLILLPSSCSGDLLDLLAIPVLVPARDVVMESEQPVVWKKTWDAARYLVRTGDFAGAEKKYEELFVLKKDIEVARWEYGRILLHSGKWEKAAATLELLVEGAPERVDYLGGLGLALRNLGHFSRALELFRKAHGHDSTDLVALAGLAQGLVEVGRKKEAFPLFEEIAARKPDDPAIHRALANLAFELGKLDMARTLMMPLVAGNGGDLDALLMTARIYEELKQERTAAMYWQRCLQHDPANREARGRLALYFEKLGQPTKAMPHLLALLANDPRNPSLLSRICRIYIQTDHFAEALPYFERYVSLQPDNFDDFLPLGKGKAETGSDAIALYRRLLAVTPDDLQLLDDLANDLLRAGDTETALFMWEHVARLYPDRIEVYQELVDLLEKLGREQRLTEILEVLHRLAPGEIRVVSKLANLKVAQGDLQVGLEYYNKLEKVGYEGADLFQGRGALYADLGQPAAALADYKKLLALQPNRDDIRRHCIALAGKVGENSFLREQAQLLEAASDSANRDKDLLLMAQAFASAGEYEQSLLRYQRLLVSRQEEEAKPDRPNEPDQLKRQAELGLADLYRQEGLVFEAAQLLRGLFLQGGDQSEILLRLFDLALLDAGSAGEDARVWLDQYASQNVGAGRGLFMQARFAMREGDYDGAQDLLKRFLHDSIKGGKPTSPGRNGEVIRQAGLLLAEIFIAEGDLIKAERQCLAMLESDYDRDVLVVLQKIYDLDGQAEAAANIFAKLVDEAADAFELLDLARLFQRYGLSESQVATAAKVLQQAPGALAAALLQAEGLAVAGRGREAIKLLENMAGRFPENGAIILGMARYYYLGGQYASALQHCDRFLAKNPERLDAHLLKVRCVAALGDEDYAARMIRQLFPIKTEEILEKNIAAAGIKVTLPPVRRTLLQLLTFSSGKLLSVAKELMGARHLVDNSTGEGKVLNLIAVPLYARYRWDQEFRKAVTPD